MAGPSRREQNSRPAPEVEAHSDRSVEDAFSTRWLPRLPPKLMERIEGWGYDKMPDLAGKCFIVTGGTSGIGQVAARELALHGAHVIAASTQRGRVLQTCTARPPGAPPSWSPWTPPCSFLDSRPSGVPSA